MKTLIVEDDHKLARFLARVFTEQGHAVDTCPRAAEAVVLAAATDYDLVVLDWMLPDGDGPGVCRDLRRRGVATPILMLTARGELHERILGLDAGADDFVVKPFELDELLARARAVTRRVVGHGKVRVGPLEIERITRVVSLDGQRLELTTREYDLLAYLAQRQGGAASRTELLDRVWNTPFDPGSNLVEVQISRLREKLGAHASLIETVRGVGYRLVAPPCPP